MEQRQWRCARTIWIQVKFVTPLLTYILWMSQFNTVVGALKFNPDGLIHIQKSFYFNFTLLIVLL